MKRIALSLSMLLILTAIISCAQEGTVDTVTETNTESVESESVVETESVEELYLKTVPEASYFEGQEFCIGWAQQEDKNEVCFTLDEATGDSIHEAIYERNRLTEEKLGITICGTRMSDWLGFPTAVSKLIKADVDDIDVYCASMVQTIKTVMQGYVYDMSSIETINFDHPWWDTTSIKEMYSFGTDNIYFATGAINYTDDYSLGAIIFNKRLCGNMDVVPYQDIDNNTWTMDTYFNYLKLFGSDVNGDSKFTGDDMYGTVAASGALSYLIACAGEHLIQFDDAGDAFLNSSERFYDVIAKALPVLNDVSAAQYCLVDINKNIGWDIGGALFPNGHAGFNEQAVNALSNLRFSMEDEFGILPYPKYDEKQETYYSPMSTAMSTAYSIPVTNDKPEVSAWIMDIMGAYSVDTVQYAATEKVLMGKLIRDNESEKTLDIIFNSKFFNLGFWGSGIYDKLSQMLASGKDNVSSIIEKNQKTTKNEFKKIKEYYNFQ